MTALVGGRDDPSETKESLPSHSRSLRPGRSPSGGRTDLRHKAGRLTKPPRGGRWRACPSADAKAAGFVKRPSGTKGLRAGGTGTGGRPDLRVKDLPGRKRDFGQRVATGGEELRLGSVGQDRASARGLRTRRNPGLRLMDRQAEPKASARGSRHRRNRCSGKGTGSEGKRNVSSETAKRRTVRASALSGSQRGNRKRL